MIPEVNKIHGKAKAANVNGAAGVVGALSPS